MIIRSQDKKSFTTNLDLLVMEIAKRHEIVDGKRNTVAIYSTEEKAIKVLDMIQEKFQEPIYQNDIGCNEIAIYKSKVFQMPKDEEVEE